MTTRTKVLLVVVVIPLALIAEGFIYNINTHGSDPNRFSAFGPLSEWLSPQSLIISALAIGLGFYVRYRIGASSRNTEKNLGLFAKIKGWHSDSSIGIDHILPKYFLRYSTLLNNLRLTNSSIVYKTKLDKDYTYAANISVARESLDITESFALSVMVTVLQTGIDGKMRIWPAENSLFSAPDQFDLGTTEYNKEIGLQADPKNIPEKVLDPSFFTWYLSQTKKPFVTIEKNMVLIALRGKLSLDDWELLWEQHQFVVNAIKKAKSTETLGNIT